MGWCGCTMRLIRASQRRLQRKNPREIQTPRSKEGLKSRRDEIFIAPPPQPTVEPVYGRKSISLLQSSKPFLPGGSINIVPLRGYALRHGRLLPRSIKPRLALTSSPVPFSLYLPRQEAAL